MLDVDASIGFFLLSSMPFLGSLKSLNIRDRYVDLVARIAHLSLYVGSAIGQDGIAQRWKA